MHKSTSVRLYVYVEMAFPFNVLALDYQTQTVIIIVAFKTGLFSPFLTIYLIHEVVILQFNN